MNGALLALGIAAAGGLGAATRHLVDRSIADRFQADFPWGVMLINLTGSFALGILAGLSLGHPVADVAAVGFLGGYTTFSTASLDTVQLLRRRRTWAALLNGPGMLLAGTALAVLGIVLGRS